MLSKGAYALECEFSECEFHVNHNFFQKRSFFFLDNTLGSSKEIDG